MQDGMASKCSDKALESFLPFDYHPTPETLKKIAWEELGETEALKEKCLMELKKLVKDHHVACISTDEFLLRFLRCQEFHVQKTFETLRNYASFRVSMHEKFLNFQPELIKTFLDLKIIGFLKFRDAEGIALSFFRPGTWNPDISTMDELQTIGTLFSLYVTESELSQIVGVSHIYDAKDLTFSFVIRQIPYINFWRKFLLECLPVRYQALHLVIRDRLGRFALPLIEPLIPRKLKEKFHYYGVGEEVCKNVSPNILPEEYGGNLGPVKSETKANAMIEYLHKINDEQRHFVR